MAQSADNKDQNEKIGSRYALLKDRFQIDTKTPFPDLDVARNKAYEAEALGRVNEKLFAIVCERHMLTRTHLAHIYQKIEHDNALKLLDYGIVFWPPAKQERYVLIYRHTVESRLIKDSDKQALGMNQDTVMNGVVIPFVELFQDMYNRDFIHGAIRPGNIFTARARGGAQKFILGDALSTQASFTQPSLYETIDRAQADPLARGLGVRSDDLYSFGVTLAVMMRSHDPMAGMDDEDVVREKIAKGSYAAITGKDRFRGSILELLRGLLNDDPRERWTLEEVQDWLDGKRLPPKQTLKRRNASRPFEYCGKKYSQSGLLAMSLDILPKETVKVVEDGTLEQWLLRALDDRAAAERLEDAYQAAKKEGRAKGYEDRIVANVSSALDTTGPIRFRGQRMSGNGIGAALYEAMVLKQDIVVFKDLFSQGVAMSWLNASDNMNIEVNNLLMKYDSCKAFLRQGGRVGYGIERCLYMLAPEAPCLSPTLQKYYVQEPGDILRAFEKICEKGSISKPFLDAHTIAFLYEHAKPVIQPQLNALNIGQGYARVFATLKCFAMLQKLSKISALPNICAVLGDQLSSVYTRFHDRQTRERIENEAEQHIKSGDMPKLVALFDNKATLAKDFSDFKEKFLEYDGLIKEYEELKAGLKDEKNFGKETGHYVSAIVATILSIGIVILVAMQHFQQGF